MIAGTACPCEVACRNGSELISSYSRERAFLLAAAVQLKPFELPGGELSGEGVLIRTGHRPKDAHAEGSDPMLVCEHPDEGRKVGIVAAGGFEEALGVICETHA